MTIRSGGAKAVLYEGKTVVLALILGTKINDADALAAIHSLRLQVTSLVVIKRLPLSIVPYDEQTHLPPPSALIDRIHLRSVQQDLLQQLMVLGGQLLSQRVAS